MIEMEYWKDDFMWCLILNLNRLKKTIIDSYSNFQIIASNFLVFNNFIKIYI